MKLVTFSIDRDKNLIIQFPVFIQPYTQQLLILYQLETVPVPITDENMQSHSCTHLQVDRPYTALTSEIYITIQQQELRMCKGIGYKFYCKELFVIETYIQIQLQKPIYFDLDPEFIKENCQFHFYYNKMDITATVLDGGNAIILANLPND